MEITSFSSDDISQFYPTTPFSELSSPSSLKKRRILIDTDASSSQVNDVVDYLSSNSYNIKDILASFNPSFNHPQFDHSAPMINQQFIDVLDFDTNVGADEPECSDATNTIEQHHQQQQQQQQSPSRKKRSRSVMVEPSVPQQRRLWVKDRSKDWWEKRSHPDFPPEEFKKDFRMSKSTFDFICEELEPVITKKDTMLRAAIPVNHRVAVCIWRLATGEPLRLVSKRFGLGISTCHKLVIEVCSAIKTTLMPRFLQWPDDARMSAIKHEFEVLSGIPNVGGSIYTTHIPIIAPKVNVGAYFNKRHTERNQKTSYSITVQGVVDPNGVFTDVCIGWPGSMPDDKVLEQSALSQRASRGLLNNVWMVGNSGYPLMDWVLVPYNHQNLTWAQHTFNEKIGVIEKVGFNAFGRLKKRWGCLQKRTEVKLQELPVLLGACCVLHNICEMRNEGMDPEIDNSYQLYDDEMVPEEHPIRSAAAVQARDQIAHNLLHHGGLPGAFL